MEDVRAVSLFTWAREVVARLGASVPAEAELALVSDDASFRRYFRFDPRFDARLNAGTTEMVFVDAPPDREDNDSFIKISKALLKYGLCCPEVFAVDLDNGFLAVTDLGDSLYLPVITDDPARLEPLYDSAVETLVKMLGVSCDVPEYDEPRLMDEMKLFPDWFLAEKLNLPVSPDINAMLAGVYSLLVQSALEQPKFFVHRDYHSRNLMVVPEGGPGIIDFQDAVMGPVTYDLVSLFKDCYYHFDRNIVTSRVEQFRSRLVQLDLLDNVPAETFLKWFDFMGVQRHLKCVGIFSRLHIRDGKARYLSDIPLVVSYLIEAAGLYPELYELRDFLVGEVESRLMSADFSPGKTS